MRKISVTLAVGGKFGIEMLQDIKPRNNFAVVAGDDRTADAALSLGFNVSEEVPESRYLLSLRFPRILDEIELGRVQQPVNIHPGYLPTYRGLRPTFWAIYENGPAGVSVHGMNLRIDSGPIYARQSVQYGSKTTGGQLQAAVSIVEKALFQDFLSYMSDKALPMQLTVDETEGNLKTLSDFICLRDHPPLESMSPDQTDRLIRALTHPEFDLPNWAVEVHPEK